MLTRKLLSAGLCLASALAFSSCSKETESVTKSDEVTSEVLAQIKQLGFTAQGAMAVEGGYVVEGDIFLSNDNLANPAPVQLMRVGAEEQYRTTNLVNVGSGRTITVTVSTALPTAYVTATDEAIRRFNAENLLMKMTRVTSGGEITLAQAPKSARYLASAGFPTSAGNPHNQVLINSKAIGTANPSTYIATILAHEIGHCIGFRHTDYMDRSYSCGGSTSNEGASTVGAILIPGTPAAADPNSFMLACIGSGVDRPFNANDKIALNALY
ncbi:M57 family metalloprotease [Hymenobacter arizonensis]|uniref:Dual-action HEIGH metallo-peptidase n=1 Tax=Hymenobacter arizonensis TaxID=1227077 RepID=A0A1I5Y0P8_HYMAR|nr:M57 family metalloprotease [Hymenobacter arizonensis]SFQ37714.1 Dual-action HEIGH metallo-peptidase [Hymenobacter arizonensis]